MHICLHVKQSLFVYEIFVASLFATENHDRVIASLPLLIFEDALKLGDQNSVNVFIDTMPKQSITFVRKQSRQILMT